MNLGKYIFGIREEHFLHVDQKDREEQFLSYNLLTAMFLVLVVLAFVSGMCYGLTIFQSWIAAILIGLFFSSITFILLLLVLFLNMNTNHRDLHEKMTNFEDYYQTIKQNKFESITDEEALVITTECENELRKQNVNPKMPDFHLSYIFITITKVVLVLVISIIVANGIEMLIFHKKLNETFSMIRQSNSIRAAVSDTTSISDLSDIRKTDAEWTLNMLIEKPEEPFILIDSYSFLLSFEILDKALGNWKIAFDLVFSILYLIPFVLVRKSKRYAEGVYLKELALAHISTSLLFKLLTERECASIKKQLENYDYAKLLKSPVNE